MKTRRTIFGLLLGILMAAAFGCQRNIVRAEPPSVARLPPVEPLSPPTAPAPPAEPVPVPAPEPETATPPPVNDIGEQPVPPRPRPAPAEAEPKPRSDAPAPVIAPQLSAKQQADAAQRTTADVQAAERIYYPSLGRRLNPSQKDLQAKIKGFLDQAHDAIRTNDWVRGENLAHKAQVLAAELAKSF